MVRRDNRELLIPGALLMLVASASSAEGGGLWASWDVFEPDKCASVWLIKRHIDPDARFRFYASGVHIEEGIPLRLPRTRSCGVTTMRPRSRHCCGAMN